MPILNHCDNEAMDSEHLGIELFSYQGCDSIFTLLGGGPIVLNGPYFWLDFQVCTACVIAVINIVVVV